MANIGTVIDVSSFTTDYRMEKNMFPGKLLSSLKMLKEQGIYLCGGSALALYLGQNLDSINDYDFYVKDQNTQNWFERWLESELKMYAHFKSNNATTYRPTMGTTKGKLQIIIKNFFNSYDDIFSTFDFGVCKVGYDGEGFYFGPNTKQQILEKRLVLEGKPSPDFVKRWFKYGLKGYKMPHSEAAEILKSLPEVEFDARNEMGY